MFPRATLILELDDIPEMLGIYVRVVVVHYAVQVYECSEHSTKLLPAETPCTIRRQVFELSIADFDLHIVWIDVS